MGTPRQTSTPPSRTSLPASAALADEGEIVQIGVPRRYYAEVIQFLSRLMGLHSGSAQNPDRAWTKDELRQLRRMLFTLETARMLLVLTARLDGDPLSFSELCEAASETRATVRGELARLANIARKHFRHEQWPLVVQAVGNEKVYRMTPEVASLWRQLDEER